MARSDAVELLEHRDRTTAAAIVQGATGRYFTVVNRSADACTCRARTGCSHTLALRLTLAHRPEGTR